MSIDWVVVFKSLFDGVVKGLPIAMLYLAPLAIVILIAAVKNLDSVFAIIASVMSGLVWLFSYIVRKIGEAILWVVQVTILDGNIIGSWIARVWVYQNGLPKAMAFTGALFLMAGLTGLWMLITIHMLAWVALAYAITSVTALVTGGALLLHTPFIARRICKTA